MRRGDLISIALQGDAGKPRPALVVQSDLLPPRANVLVVPLTSDLDDAPLSRMIVEPSAANGLRVSSQLMFDRLQSAPRDRCRGPFGRLDPTQVGEVNARLAVVLGLTDPATP